MNEHPQIGRILSLFCLTLTLAIPVAGAQDPQEMAQCLVFSTDDVSYKFQCRDELAGLQQFYATAPQPLGTSTASLDTILATLPQLPTKQLSLQDRLWLWLSNWLDGEGGRFDRWLENLPAFEKFFAGILYVCMALIVLTAAVMLFMEIKRIRRTRRALPSRPSGQISFTPRQVVDLTWQDVEAAPLAQQPVVLLRFLLADLVRRQQIADPRGLTHKDILSLDRNRGGSALGRIAQAAERALYGNWQPDAGQMRELLDAGEQMLMHSKSLSDE